jgi:hypothetical protein
MVGGREFPYEMDRRARLADLHTILQRRFFFAGGSFKMRLGAAELSPVVRLDALLGLDQRKLTVIGSDPQLVVKIEGHSHFFAIDAHVADVIKQIAPNGQEVRFFSDQEKTREIFRNPKADLACLELPDEVFVELSPCGLVSVKLVLPPTQVCHAIELRGGMTMCDILKWAQDIMQNERSFVPGVYGLSNAPDAPSLPLSGHLIDFCGEQKEVLLFVQFFSEPRPNTLLLPTDEGPTAISGTDPSPRRGRKKPRSYAKDVKKLIEGTGHSDRFCRQCFNCCGYNFAETFAALTAMRVE